jgi:hypothetical protein
MPVAGESIMLAQLAWSFVIVALLGSIVYLVVMAHWPQEGERRKLVYHPWSPTSGELAMRGRLVGWIRTHWRHWEPIVWGDDTSDVWDQLRAFPSSDEDGERVVLPHGQRPVELCRRDLS